FNDGPVGTVVAGAYTTDEESYLDVLKWQMVPAEGKIYWVDEKYRYPALMSDLYIWCALVQRIYDSGPPLPGLGASGSAPLNSGASRGPNPVQNLLTQRAAIEGRSAFASCDLNWDGACNATDRQMIHAAVGKCWSPGERVPFAASQMDLDQDGCITQHDY